MPKPKFPRPSKDGFVPTQGNTDELLADPPKLPIVGGLTGYRAGSKVRRWVLGGLIVGVLGAGFAGRWYVLYLEEQEQRTVPQYELAADDVAHRPREFHWSEGKARLGLSREPPGVNRIVLPDRVLSLADGYDYAQLNVEVVNGQTVRVKVIKGKIAERLIELNNAPPS